MTEFLLFEDAILEDLILEFQDTSSKKNTHFHHLEDMIITHGPKGFDHVADTLMKTHDHLTGKKSSGFSLSTKFDGYPSVVFGHHPQTKKFFVGTKSFFNKTPKVNYTDADVDANHGSSKTLANKMKFLLKNLKGVSPKEGVFQGDLMYTSDDINHGEGNDISFTPNTLTYNVPKNSHEGRKILKSKIGMALHTSYQEDHKGNLNANFNVNHNEFKPHDDIHFFPTSLRGPFNYRGEEQSNFNRHLANATEAQRQLEKSGAHEIIDAHQRTLLGYINHTVKARKEPSVEGYVSFLYGQAGKSDDAKSVKKALGSEVENVVKNKKVFQTLFKAHRSIQDAKNVLVGSLSKNSPYRETILGNASKPEGFVASNNGVASKLIDRQHFSAANFDWNEKVNPEDNPTVLHWGRFNPGTAGHEKMLKHGADIARRIGAKQKVVASRTTDSKNNPLTPSQKIQWLKSMFPGQDIAIAGEGQSTILAQLQHLHNSGVRDITMVVGHDRIKDFQNVLAKYNGEGKMFNFRRARVVSGGNRDPDSEDNTESISASKMRKAAKDNDYKTFHSGLPSHLQGKHDKAQELFHDLRSQMGAVKVNSTTPGNAINVLSKKKGKLGKEAKAELNRRKRHGIWRGE